MFEACAAPETLGLGVIATVGSVDDRRCRLGAVHAGRSGFTEPFYLCAVLLCATKGPSLHICAEFALLQTEAEPVVGKEDTTGKGKSGPLLP